MPGRVMAAALERMEELLGVLDGKLPRIEPQNGGIRIGCLADWPREQTARWDGLRERMEEVMEKITAMRRVLRRRARAHARWIINAAEGGKSVVGDGGSWGETATMMRRRSPHTGWQGRIPPFPCGPKRPIQT